MGTSKETTASSKSRGSRKKRSRPTKLRVKDHEALAELLRFGIYHRAAIADHLFKRFRAAKHPGDRLSIGAEVVFCSIAAVEDLEMLYYAVRGKASRPARSFFAEYAGTHIREPQKRKDQKPNVKSARNMRRQLRTMSLREFQQKLGLPAFEDWLKLKRTPRGAARSTQRKLYHSELREIKNRLWQAVQNRSLNRLMNAYNKIKHGFVVLPASNESILLVEYVKSVGKRTSSVQAMPFRVTEQAVRRLVENLKLLSLTVRQLLFLYTRAEMIPPKDSR